MKIDSLNIPISEINPWVAIPILLTIWVFVSKRRPQRYPDNALAGLGMIFEAQDYFLKTSLKIILALVAWVVYFWIF